LIVLRAQVRTTRAKAYFLFGHALETAVRNRNLAKTIDCHFHLK
jgi:hypothetical protein